MRVTQGINFECCYISDHKLNAHRYRAEVTVSGEQRYLDTGFVLEFDKFKKYLREVVPDGKFILAKYGYSGDVDEANVRDVGVAMAKCGIMTQEFTEASCEVMCEEIAHKLQQEFYLREPGIVVEEVKLRETPDSFAVWTNNQNKSL